MLRRIATALVALGVVGVWAGDAQAQYGSYRDRGSSRGSYGKSQRKPVTLRLSIQGDFFLHGDASDASGNPPSYAKAEGIGFGVMTEVDYRLIPEISLHFGLGYLHHVGGDDAGIDFDPWSVIPIFAGAKLYPQVGMGNGVEPYLRADLGVGLSQPNDIEGNFGAVPFTADFYENSTLFMFGIGFGVAYNPPGSQVVLHAELMYRGFTGPEIDTSPSAEGEFGGAFNFAIGIGFMVG